MIVELVKFFDKYPLSDCTLRKQARFFLSFGVPGKKGDYLLFKQAFELGPKKEHFSVEGLKPCGY